MSRKQRRASGPIRFPSSEFDPAIPNCFKHRYLLALFRAAAQGRPGALLQGQRVRAVLVGHQVQRHHGGRDQPRRSSRRQRRSAASPSATRRPDLRRAELHRDGPAEAQRAAQDRGADVHADAPRPARDQHPRARRPSASTICRATRRSTGSTTSRSNSPRRCWPTLFDFPWEDRRKLTHWSDVATAAARPDGVVATEDERQDELMECASYFTKLWNERVERSRRRAT